MNDNYLWTMQQIIQFIQNLPAFVKNKYFLTAALFFIWMLLFDQNNMISQFKKNRELNELEEKKAYYIEEIKQVEIDHDELFSTQENLERFARERYWMKKDNEEIFVLVERN